MINYISSWQKRLRARLYKQFRNQPRFIAFADLIARQAQDVEDAFQSLLTMPSIDDSEGEQLRVIGRRVGQPNLGWTDVLYRRFLKTRILINRSGGTVKQLYGILNQALGELGFLIRYGGTKQFSIEIGQPITSVEAAATLLFVEAAKDAGARGVVEWSEVPLGDQLFHFDVGPGFDVGKLGDAADRQR